MSADAQLQAGAETANGLAREGVTDSTPAPPAGAGRPRSFHPTRVQVAIDRARRETNLMATGPRFPSAIRNLVTRWGFRKWGSNDQEPNADGRAIVMALRLEKIRRALHYAGSPLAEDIPAIRRIADTRGRWELQVQDVIARGFDRVSRDTRHEIHPGLTRCRACAGRVVGLKTKTGRRVIVDAETTEPTDTGYDPPRHRAHWSTCPHARDLRNRKCRKYDHGRVAVNPTQVSIAGVKRLSGSIVVA
jgi:hypothetical protein